MDTVSRMTRHSIASSHTGPGPTQLQTQRGRSRTAKTNDYCFPKLSFETSGRLRLAARPGFPLRRCCGTRPARRRTLHGGPQDTIDARLVSPAVGLQPLQDVRVQADGELLLPRWPCFRCLGVERLVKGRNVRIVDLGIFHAVNS